MIYWLTVDEVLHIHAELLRQDGGLFGVRSEDLLQSALARPRNLEAYENETDLPRLAAAYGFGIARNHPFADGNKRTSFMAMYSFLGANGLWMNASEPEAVYTITRLAAGELSEEELTEWLRQHTEPR